MSYLTVPSKQPEYRRNRDHTTFLTKLVQHVDDNKKRGGDIMGDTGLRCTDSLEKDLVRILSKTYDVKVMTMEDVESLLTMEYRKTNRWVEL